MPPLTVLFLIAFYCLATVLGGNGATAAPSSSPAPHTSPPNITWTKGFTFGASESHPHAGVECADGGFLVVGDGIDYTRPAPPAKVHRSIMVLRTDAAGNVRWNRTMGDQGWNYGKFGIQLKDGNLLVAGGWTTGQPAALHRALALLSDADGSVLSTTVMPNTGAALGLRELYMSVAQRPNGHVVAVGVVGGENATTGYVDEPMFLIGGGRVSATSFRIDPDTYAFTVLHDVEVAGGTGFDTPQAMRVLNHPDGTHVAVSHTTTFDGGSNFQFGLTMLDAATLVAEWTHAYPAGAGGMDGHASHPYALTVAQDGGVVVGGLAVIFDANNIEQCQGRLVKIGVDGSKIFDRRFTSALPDTNIECYGAQTTLDGGFILTCGTGVEPELHPKDSQKSKTWRVLVHRTDPDGNQLWDTDYTTNDALQNNAGEYILALRDGGYAVYVDSQTWGSSSTGGNFAIMKLAGDVWR